MQRRQFLKSSTVLLGAFPLSRINYSGIFSSCFPMNDEVVTIKIGALTCTFFRDMLHTYLSKDFFSNATPEELSPALTKHRITPDNIPSPFIAVLLQTENKKVLIDTGLGFSKNPIPVGGTTLQLKGRLHQLLQGVGMRQEDITDVVITHLHPDHIGGIYSEEGTLLFPNARFHMHDDEWAYWHSAQSAKQPPMFHYFIEKNITKLKGGNLNLFKGDFVDLLPGITAVKSDGHTPGQIALIIHSGKEKLLYTSDTFLHPLHIERLDWQTSYDLDHAKAKHSRIKLLDLAHSEGMLVNAFHFSFPGLGRVDKHQNRWVWRYGHK